jgi:hypothetical protein
MKHALVLALAAWTTAVDLAAQQRGFATGGGSSSTDRVVSAAVVASWMSFDSYADGSKTTLLVLWRGAPGWFAKSDGRAGGGGSSGGGGGSGSHAFQYFSRGGVTFSMEYDHEQHTVKILNETFSLKEVNVVLVDFVGSQAGAAIVGWRWIDPGPPAPPLVPGALPDPVAGVIRRSDELFDYLRCDVSLPEPVMRVLTSFVCGLMKPSSR